MNFETAKTVLYGSSRTFNTFQPEDVPMMNLLELLNDISEIQTSENYDAIKHQISRSMVLRGIVMIKSIMNDQLEKKEMLYGK